MGVTRYSAILLLIACRPIVSMGDDRQFLCLTTSQLPYQAEGPASERRIRNFFLQELIGQSVLLAAREAYGLATRDQSLREPFLEATDGVVHLDVDVSVFATTHIQYHLRRGEASLAQGIIRFSDDNRLAFEAISEDAEALTQTDFIKALDECGFQRKDIATDRRLDVPNDVTRALAKMNFVSQYEAIRHCHELISEEGPTVRLLGALSRGFNVSRPTMPEITAVSH